MHEVAPLCVPATRMLDTNSRQPLEEYIESWLRGNVALVRGINIFPLANEFSQLIERSSACESFFVIASEHSERLDSIYYHPIKDYRTDTLAEVI